MLIIELPNELLILILSFINDNYTYKSSRISCKRFHNILKDNIIFKNNIPIYTLKYFDNKIEHYNNKGELEKEILFLKYGEIKTVNYITKNNPNNTFTEFNIKPPNYAVIIEQNNYFLKKAKFNFKDNDLKTTNIPRYIPHPCIIS